MGMMGEFIREFILFLIAACDEILSWMIEIWMEIHLVSNNLQHSKSIIPQKIHKEWQIVLGL